MSEKVLKFTKGSAIDQFISPFVVKWCLYHGTYQNLGKPFKQ